MPPMPRAPVSPLWLAALVLSCAPSASPRHEHAPDAGDVAGDVADGSPVPRDVDGDPAVAPLPPLDPHDGHEVHDGPEVHDGHDVEPGIDVLVEDLEEREDGLDDAWALDVEAPPPAEDPARVRLDRVLVEIFLPSCAGLGCHDASTASGGLDLDDDPGLHARLVALSSVGMPYVTPGQPDASYLWRKVTDTHRDIGGRGESMPYGAPALSSERLERLRAWIEAGALPELESE